MPVGDRGECLKRIPLLLIRKNGFTEVVSFENGKIVHEMGDKISRASVREAVLPGLRRTKRHSLKNTIKQAVIAKSTNHQRFKKFRGFAFE